MRTGNGQRSRENGARVCLCMMRGGAISFLRYRSNLHDTTRKMVETTLSLASGTFVLLVRLFFRFSGMIAACRAPKGERQNENQLYICKR